MSNNLPSDWKMYYRECPKCRTRYHASDGACFRCIENQGSKKETINGD